MSCPDDNAISQYFTGQLDAQSQAQLEEHIDQCQACRHLLAELTKSSLVETVASEDGQSDSKKLSFTAGDKVGRFIIQRHLGSGGMGVVYLAHDPELERHVVLKFLKAKTPVEQESRMLREARSMARSGSSVENNSQPSAKKTIETTSDLTMTGELLGTPAYMAPEQIQGKAIDVKTDQFSFCVALFEALYRKRPFAGKNLAEIKNNIVSGKLETPPPNNQTPAWLRNIVYRGLNPDPEKRYFSMEQLISRFDRGLRRNQYLWTGAASVLVLLAMVVFIYNMVSVKPCQGAEAKLAGIWDDPVAVSMKKSFLATQLPFAKQTFKTTADILDKYRQDWLFQHQEACLATQVRKERSTTEMDLRMRCLDDRLEELKVTLEFLAQADNEIVAKSVEIAGNLTSPVSCADQAVLTSLPPLPKDPILKEKVVAIRKRFKKIEALEHAGKDKAAMQLAQEALTANQEVDYPALTAESLYWLGRMESVMGQPYKAGETLSKVVQLATVAEHKILIAHAWIALVSVRGAHGNNPEKGLELGKLAQDMISKNKLSQKLQAQLHINKANVLSVQHKHAESLAELDRAEKIYHRIYGRNHPAWIDVRSREVDSLIYLGEYKKAEKVLSELQKTQLEILGPQHPTIAYTLSQSGYLKRYFGQPEELSDYQQALQILKSCYGEQHPTVSGIRQHIADYYAAIGKDDLALEQISKAIAIDKKIYGGQHRYMASNLLSLGDIYHNQAKFKLAIETLEQALDITKTVAHPHHSGLAMVYISLAEVNETIGNLAAAQEYYEKALDILAHNKSEAIHEIACLVGLVSVYIEQDDFQKAFLLIEQAKKIALDRVGPDSPEYAEYLYQKIFYYIQKQDLIRARKFIAQLHPLINKISLPDSYAFVDYHDLFGLLEHKANNHKQAEYHFRKSLELWNSIQANNKLDISISRIGLGRALLDQNQPQKALADIEKAHQVISTLEGDPIELAEAEFAYARVLWDTRKDRPRAIKLAKSADKRYRTHQRFTAKQDSAQVTAWLKRYGSK
jgi:tetratricopeptide (TPR) repeat protein